MKLFSITSLLTGSLLLILLDHVPIPSSSTSSGSSCKDKHKVQKEVTILEPVKKLEKIPKLTTGEVISRGETWVEIYGKLDIEDRAALNYIKEYGIAYAQNTEKDSDKKYTDVPASELKDDNSFTVKISDLKPDVSYVYCAYVQTNSYNNGIVRTRKLLDVPKILEKYNK